MSVEPCSTGSASKNDNDESESKSGNVIIDATPDDATTCPSCRVAVTLGHRCDCPMRWIG